MTVNAGDKEIDKLILGFSDIFEGIAQLPGEHKITLKADATPVIHPPRRVPVATHYKVKQELERMEKHGIIAKVSEPTDWVNSMVVVHKPNGDLKVCLDPTDLNKATKRPFYPAPTLNDVTSKLSGSRHFSLLDARSGYWQIKLSDESSYLSTFNTPCGGYNYLRMPFGINLAQDVFQRHVDETYEGLERVTGVSADVLVSGKTKKEHLHPPRSAFERARKHGQRYNLEKCRFNVPEVRYCGHIISEDGIKPDLKKVEAIINMAAPTYKAELQTILGMANYLAKFAPNLSDITVPMRDLLKKDIEFL